MSHNSNEAPEPYLTPRQAAEYLGYGSVQTIYNKICAREIPFYRRGRTVRFRRSELDAWIRDEWSPDTVIQE